MLRPSFSNSGVNQVLLCHLLHLRVPPPTLLERSMTHQPTTVTPVTWVAPTLPLDRMRRLPKESSFEKLQQSRDVFSTRDWFRTSYRILDDRERLEPFLYPSILSHSTFTFDA